MKKIPFELVEGIGLLNSVLPNDSENLIYWNILFTKIDHFSFLDYLVDLVILITKELIEN